MPFERRFYAKFGIITLFSSPEPKAHKMPPSGVHPSVRRSSIRPSSSTISNIFLYKTTGPVIAKFYVEPLWVGGTKVCSRHLGHMTKMAAKPIYGKNSSKIFSGTSGLISMKLGL